MKDILITDFQYPMFQKAFKLYFTELGITVSDWQALFQEMNGSDENMAYLRVTEEDEVIGFIQFCPITLDSWFFREECGFIREFWISEPYRKAGHGSDLLALAEDRLFSSGIGRVLLTSDTAPGFYFRKGYQKAPFISAKNQMDVFVKSFDRV